MSCVAMAWYVVSFLVSPGTDKRTKAAIRAIPSVNTRANLSGLVEILPALLARRRVARDVRRDLGGARGGSRTEACGSPVARITGYGPLFADRPLDPKMTCDLFQYWRIVACLVQVTCITHTHTHTHTHTLSLS